MSTRISPKPIGMMAPWWSALNKAEADGKITKTEVKKYIEPFKSYFEKPGTYRDELSKDLFGKGVRMTDAARKELFPLMYGMGAK